LRDFYNPQMQFSIYVRAEHFKNSRDRLQKKHGRQNHANSSLLFFFSLDIILKKYYLILYNFFWSQDEEKDVKRGEASKFD